METKFAVKLSHAYVGANLPEVIIKMNAAPVLFPEARPTWKIEVNPMDIGNGFLSQRSLDRRTIIFPSYHPDFVKTSNLSSPVPAHSRLRALFRFARVCRSNHSHRYGTLYPVARV